jgi:ABC-2 type transport system ATP-binding protein
MPVKGGASPAPPAGEAAKGGSYIIKAEGISHAYDHRGVLRSVSFGVRKGEIFGLIGPSGAGKTTLLNILVGFVVPSQGDVVVNVDGKPFSVFREQHRVKRIFGFATQDPSFYGKLTAWENLLHYGALYGLTPAQAAAKASSLLKMVGLWDSRDNLGQNLSGGMQKRLDIACALVHEPPLLILDEPTADIDPLLRQQLWGLIREINRRGTTIILASHFLGEVEQLCSRIGIVHANRLQHVGTADELRRLYTLDHEVEVRLESEKGAKALLDALRGNRRMTKTFSSGILVRLYTSRPEELIDDVITALAKNRIPYREARVSRPPMREVFEALVKPA